MADDNHTKQQQLDIELSAEVADGTYSNLAIISHSTSEFVLDFIRMVPGVPKAKVKSRVILTPEHAKRLLLSLQDNIHKYETSFGEIRIPQQVPTPGKDFPFGFNGGGEA
ncbi:MAG: DUF3467 domain-containing protein [Rikenellaceae bacterium]|jgi:hypothetical protein|nr:DUF3467 domain-containing protein [Rikenellaceae bacterium]